MRFWFAGLAVLALAACNENAHETGHSGDQAGLGEEAMEADPVPADIAPEDGQTSALIPARFHGVWDYVEGSCARESDMRLEISGNEVMFYESIGTVTDIEQRGPNTFVTLAMEGEGETWEDTYTLALSDDEQLFLQYISDNASSRPLPRKRCPQ